MATDVYKLLSAIHKRPVMYLGEPSLWLLASFLFGYISALETNEIEIEENPSFRGFQSWVVMKLQSNEGNVVWNYLLVKSCNGDAEKAFEKFFVYLEEFKDKKEKILVSVQLPLASTPKTEKVLRSDGRYYRESLVCLVQIVEYAGAEGAFVRCIGADGKLKDERYSFSFELALEYAEMLYGVRKEDWKLTEK
ncbi:MAG: hypothetical protein IPN69_18500 [Acidobacteria bacterium]|nr:hypothetical protein [Acidobacteriota bacterium]